MAGVQRLGDPNTAGGVIMTADFTVRADGRPVAVAASSVSPHPCCGAKGCPPTHCHAKTTFSNSTVRANGKPITTTGSYDTCGHSRATGSLTVRIG